MNGLTLLCITNDVRYWSCPFLKLINKQLCQIVAYELLYRDSLENTFPMINAEIATKRLVEEHLLNSNINKLVDNKPYFINFTEKCILADLPVKLINKPIIIEVLEDVPPTKAIFISLIIFYYFYNFFCDIWSH